MVSSMEIARSVSWLRLLASENRCLFSEDTVRLGAFLGADLSGTGERNLIAATLDRDQSSKNHGF